MPDTSVVLDDPILPHSRSATYDSLSTRSSSGSINTIRHQTLTVSRDDAFRVNTTTYPFRSKAVPGQDTELRLDPDTQVFGCDELRRRLKRCFATFMAPEDVRAPVTIHDPHIFWHTSLYGSGTRTMVESLCAKNLINLIVASTQAGRNSNDLCIALPFAQGQYARMVEDAIRIAPCVLFIDRLDPHFEINYEEAGHELIGAWDAYEERCNRSNTPVPFVWIVISTAYSLSHTMGHSAVNPMPRLYQHETMSEALGVNECTEILCNSYMFRACKAQIVLYDYPSATSTVESEYLRMRNNIVPLMRHIAQGMHQAAFQHKFLMKGIWLFTLIKAAFEAAAIRVSCDETTPSQPRGLTQLQRYLPTREEICKAVRCLPLDAFKQLEFS